MGGSGSNKIYTHLIQLLKSRGFVDLSCIHRNNQKFYLADYGPPGTLLRHNIIKQWWDVMTSQQSQVFPVESPAVWASEPVDMTSAGSLSGDVSLRENLQRDCISKYLQVLKLTNGKLPLSIANVGPCLSWKAAEDTESEEKTLLFGSSNQTRLLLQNYVSPTGTNSVFDYWLQLRLSWWKKFSRNPANFSVVSNSNNNNKNNNKNNNSPTDATTSSNNNNNGSSSSMYVIYQFPWGAEAVEEIKNTGDQYLAALQKDGDKSYLATTPGKKSCLPYCIECETSVEMAMAAWLVDSFHYRQVQTTAKKKTPSKADLILHLHPQIAPYQVAIVIDSSSSTSPTEMYHLCSHLEKDLQASGVSVFNTSHHGSTMEAHFRRNDQLGVPYTVIVGEVTLSDGVVKTRNRDTTIKVTSHISTLVGDLQRNLTAQLD